MINDETHTRPAFIEAQATGKTTQQVQDERQAEASGPAARPKLYDEGLALKQQAQALQQQAEEKMRAGIARQQEAFAKQKAIEAKRAAIAQGKDAGSGIEAALADNDAKLDGWTSPLAPVHPQQWLDTLLHARLILERKGEFLRGWRAKQEAEADAMEAELRDFMQQHGIEQLPD